MKIEQILFKFPFLRKFYIFSVTKYNELKTYIPGAFKKFDLPKEGNNPEIIIVCYPETPYIFHTIYQICVFRGYTLTNKLQKASAVIFFKDDTIRQPDNKLKEYAAKNYVVNFESRDITKEKIDKVHKKIFGYGLTVNPLKNNGSYIKKANGNSFHVGEVLTTPQKPEKGYVYQKFIDSQVNDVFYELRLHIIGNCISSAYFKIRKPNERFQTTTIKATYIDPKKVLSQYEIKKILTFCKALGIDYAELDALRDKKDKRIYIVDVNNTPGGPPDNISQTDFIKAIRKQSEAFKKMFIHKTVNSNA